MITIALLAVSLASVPAASEPRLETAVFAGGCFWCMEPPFESLAGVISVVSGYTGGAEPAPTYKQVSAGGTGHVEAVVVRFDPLRISYERLLEVYWRNVDPTVDDRQFCDEGRQYRPEIFVASEAQRKAAEASKAAAAKALRVTSPIRVAVTKASRFYPAEEYHQDYYKRNPLRYKFYRRACGRDVRLHELWGG